jgi:anti-sigma factor RsiW
MDCQEARTMMLDAERGALTPAAQRLHEAHVADCEHCRHDVAADALLSKALGRLPSRRAPESLRRALDARWQPARRRGLPRALAAIAAAAAIVLVAFFVWRDASTAPEPMVAEAVNDHLRVVYSERPVEVESGGMHQVKPWFSGRLDFAPKNEFEGDKDFPLVGGSVAYFLDRKAASYVYKRRLHTVTLFVFGADGLPWPRVSSRAIGPVRGTVVVSRGFHVVLWRQHDLGYALVSDLNEGELLDLAKRVAGDGT